MSFINTPIEQACAEKWQIGQAHYGKEFVGHPLENFDEEMIDALNYLQEAEKWGYDVGSVPALVRILCERVRRIYRDQKPAWGPAMSEADYAAEAHIIANGPFDLAPGFLTEEKTDVR